MWISLYRHAAKGRSRPVVIPIAKPKPKPAKKAPSRGRGRGGRNTKIESDDEPFRSNISVKKIKVYFSYLTVSNYFTIPYFTYHIYV